MPLRHILAQSALGPNSAHAEISICNYSEFPGNEKYMYTIVLSSLE